MGGSTKIHLRQATQYDTETASKIVTHLQREILHMPSTYPTLVRVIKAHQDPS